MHGKNNRLWQDPHISKALERGFRSRPVDVCGELCVVCICGQRYVLCAI